MPWEILGKVAISLATAVLFVSCSSSSDNVKAPEVYTTTQYATRPNEPVALKTLSNDSRLKNTLSAHNTVRTAHGLNPLRWSNKLAIYAQEWADHLASTNSCFMRHRPQSNSPFKQEHGENLWWASPLVWSDGITQVQNISIGRVVQDWADEQPFYNYNANTCKAGEQCGHYTQIVWRETTHVGCAYQQCGDKSQLWVCNYNPPGNYIGERPY